ncbi:zinc finger MYM-type protein 1-like [Ruditapes philippinarum]|uniref:zinc finger MYM-type protein 1-like n=1 Tax=Ruditapes philippinarum TaxID=129788 RepID=UPI00295B9334|nr:zinc finger MYM-type protein 1-like [Ruditapes philippinarum]
MALIVDTLMLCGKQNIPIRGHREDADSDRKGNFQALLEFQAKNNPVPKDHLENGDPRTRYTSPKIQNEIIAICGKLISDEIVTECNQSQMFSLIADEATDCATMEQMALCVRYLKDSEIREEFLGFSECKSTTGEALANAFLENLRCLGVQMDYIRGQGYDGASNMSGLYRGVQARIRQQYPEAVYTHCKAHCLNLAIVHASNCTYVRNMMATVQTVAFAFNMSAKRLLNFQETLGCDPTSREEMEERQKLQSLCETRRAARADALHTFLCSYRTVVTSLEDLGANGDTKAAAYSLSVLKFDFIITLVTAEHVLAALVGLSTMLQQKACDLLRAATETRVVIATLKAINLWTA